MSLANDLDRKFFHALLNGVTQGFVYGKPNITYAYLQEQLFSASSMSSQGLSFVILCFVCVCVDIFDVCLSMS
jgi:hypothetical protein